MNTGTEMPYTKTGALISDCEQYRYALSRWWADGDPLVIIGLNPSTADATEDDPTIRRCVGFAKAWGYAGITMLNLFAFRATDPKAMRRAFDPVGNPQNDVMIRTVTRGRDVLCAWGAGGDYMARDRAVAELLTEARRVSALGLTKDGHPRHPLYVAASTERVPFTVASHAHA